jgi:hypothetical protein
MTEVCPCRNTKWKLAIETNAKNESSRNLNKKTTEEVT